MILAHHELIALVDGGVIGPVLPADINGSSIDVRLGPIVMKEVWPRLPGDTTLELGKREAVTTEEWDLRISPFVLKPGGFVLAQTAETFNLPLYLSAEFRLKSSAARMGLSHALAVWCDPGWTGSVLTLELHNISQFHSIVMRAGDKIGQMIFHAHDKVPSQMSYAKRGAYNHDSGPSAAKPPRLSPASLPPMADIVVVDGKVEMEHYRKENKQ
jgi:dCTP deaminase